MQEFSRGNLSYSCSVFGGGGGGGNCVVHRRNNVNFNNKPKSNTIILGFGSMSNLEFDKPILVVDW